MKLCGQNRQSNLRQKVAIDSQKTDREIFDELPTGDCWIDADLPGLFLYLYHEAELKIPDSWSETMASFRQEMQEWVARSDRSIN